MSRDSVDIVAQVQTSEERRNSPITLPSCFLYVGIIVGAVLGVYEAILLYTRPPYSLMERADLGPLIFVAAPLVDTSLFALLAFLLGYFAQKSTSRLYRDSMWAVLLTAAGVFFCTITFLRFWWDQEPKMWRLVLLSLGGALVLAICSMAIVRILGGRIDSALTASSNVFGRLRTPAIAVVFALAASIAAYAIAQFDILPGTTPALNHSQKKPNIVLITLDTATAGHFFCYGYSRPTTPNIDRLATGGALFENAIAASSWTLPSFASMFTGLLPHQHGASAFCPLSPRFRTLASILASNGYETAGFNANYVYGQASQGLGQGFEVYKDGSETLRQNLTQTLAGRIFVKYVYLRYELPEPVNRDCAEVINHKVLRWFAHRSSRPYFLFINYIDVHYPYLPPPSVSPFGQFPRAEARRIDQELSGRLDRGLTAGEQYSLVAAYDDSLAYVDRQLRLLLDALAKSPDWSNTVVIITGDHGEAFGEHGHYGHGWNLAREVVHVPLLMFGPGIPANRRIKRVVGTRRLFPTILELAHVKTNAGTERSSLQSLWSGNNTTPISPVVISELDVPTLVPNAQNALICITTSQWHWILDAHGHKQLFDWLKDPQEISNLADSPELSPVMASLQQILRNGVKNSPGPWQGLTYLQPLGIGRRVTISPESRDALDTLPYQ